ncbi:homocitrate synthase/isopropylmalate synthase family protein [Sporomusa ovata]|uniref:homocitrate synthase/isopropylmalate synthase family protein n=1 Tax=Sporomusa ovata TaxID=2378 RepID=UPI001376730C|nr:hypothetical protein [Sporomusa ovata]
MGKWPSGLSIRALGKWCQAGDKKTTLRVINVKKIMWLDQTLNIAIRQKFAAQKLVDFAGLLTALGIQQAVIHLDEWQCNRPELAEVQSQIQLYGFLNFLGCKLSLAEQAGIKQVVLVCDATNQVEFGTRLREIMEEACPRGLVVSLFIEGIDVLTVEALASLIVSIKKYPIAAVIYQDRVGKGNPFALFDQITLLKNSLACPIGISAGNAYGLATANTLAALKAGATQVVESVGGIGGYAPWEEVLLAARQLLGINTKLPPKLAIGCRQIYSMLDLTVPVNKAIIGPAIFAHESGLHVDGITKAPQLYEPFAPELVGLSRQLIVGKHSGTAAIRTKFATWGICLKEEESKHLLAGVRALAVRKKTAISDDELRRLYLSG